MKQTSGFISTYSADTFGVCSALYELGGMVVMHDASGCNSTYTTHDEPRWYDIDSMIYISALTEIEAIMGDTSKFVNDIVETVSDLKPEFVAIAGTPIPSMTGFDAEAAAREIEERTGIPSFGFATSGMKSYVHGAGMAFKALAERFVERQYIKQSSDKCENELVIQDYESKNTSDKLSEKGRRINVLGLTPLDFSVNGSDQAIISHYKKRGYIIGASWSMGTSLNEIRRSGDAELDQVVSETGYEAAVILKDKFAIPYRIGIPIGDEEIDITAEFEDNLRAGVPVKFCTDNEDLAEVLILGERASSLSIAKYLSLRLKKCCMAYAATDADEDDTVSVINKAEGLKYIIADPLFEPILKLLSDEKAEQITFVSLPHEAFSGRLFRNEIPDLIGDLNSVEKICNCITKNAR